MLLKCASIKLLLLLCVTRLAPAAVAPSYRYFCPQCEEEVWEEVPCDQISKSTTTTTTTESPIYLIVPTPTTPKPYTTAHPPTHAPLGYVHNLTAAAPYAPPTTTTSPYNRCYCECKVGCKEFCRKVTLDDAADKQITQITKTSNRVPYGNIETEHIHQQRFVPDNAIAPYSTNMPAAPAAAPNVPTHKVYPIEASQERAQPYVQPNLAYEVQPALHPPLQQPLAPQLAPQLPPQALPPQPLHHPQSLHHPQLPSPHSQAHIIPVSYSQHSPSAIYENSKDTFTYPDILMDASYSVDELTRLLQMESLHKDAPITYGQPQVYTPYSTAHSSIRSPPVSNSQASAPIYNNPAPPPPAPAPSSSQPSPASNAAPHKYESNLSVPHYEPALGGSSDPQYSNYIDKQYGSASSSAETNEHQSSPALEQHTAYDGNQRREYRSSAPAGPYQDHSVAHDDNQRREYRSSAPAGAYSDHTAAEDDHSASHSSTHTMSY